jgi:hypothetical protein
MLRQTRAVEVRPATTYVQGGSLASSGAGRSQGVEVLVQPPFGATPGDIARALQCKNARALLGQTADLSAKAEPFYLPNTWVSVDVMPEEGGLYSVKASAERIDENMALVDRTKEYAAANGIAVSRDLR